MGNCAVTSAQQGREGELPVLALVLMLGASCVQAQALGSVQGIVTDLTTARVHGASVALIAGDRRLTAVTDVFGAYRLEGVPPGEHRMEAWMFGFRTSRVLHLPVRAGEQKILPPLVLEIGSCAPDALTGLHLLGGQDVLGRLTGTLSRIPYEQSEPKPLAGRTVAVVPRSGEQVSTSTQTDTEGNFVIEDLRLGSYSL